MLLKKRSPVGRRASWQSSKSCHQRYIQQETFKRFFNPAKSTSPDSICLPNGGGFWLYSNLQIRWKRTFGVLSISQIVRFHDSLSFGGWGKEETSDSVNRGCLNLSTILVELVPARTKMMLGARYPFSHNSTASETKRIESGIRSPLLFKRVSFLDPTSPIRLPAFTDTIVVGNYTIILIFGNLSTKLFHILSNINRSILFALF